MNTEQSIDRGNEIIGTAHFSMGRAIFRIMGTSIVSFYLVVGGFITASRGEPLWATVLFFLLGLLALRYLLDFILYDRIIFYGNRVTKIWRVLGPRTIYFSRAKVWRNQFRGGSFEWVIRETGPNGEHLFMQKPISYDPRFFPSEASEEILSLLIDLADDEIEGARPSKKECLIAGIIPFTLFLCLLLIIYFYRK